MREEYLDPEGLDAVLYLLHPAIYDHWVITKIRTEPDHRHRGAASRVLKLACADADREGSILRLTAIPMDHISSALNGKQLWNWYFRHGFRSTGRYRVMQRAPR